MVPFSGSNVVDGVLNIQYQGQIKGNDITGLLSSALNRLVIQSLGVNDLTQAADHILFCLPNGTPQLIRVFHSLLPNIIFPLQLC